MFSFLIGYSMTFVTIPLITFLSLVQIPVFFGWLFSRWAQRWYSWNRELMADDYAKTKFGNAQNLASALAKLGNNEYSSSVYGRCLVWLKSKIRGSSTPEPITLMKLLNPLTPEIKFSGSMDSIFRTHPSTPVRIARLMNTTTQETYNFMARINQD